MRYYRYIILVIAILFSIPSYASRFEVGFDGMRYFVMKMARTKIKKYSGFFAKKIDAEKTVEILKASMGPKYRIAFDGSQYFILKKRYFSTKKVQIGEKTPSLEVAVRNLEELRKG